MVGSTSNSFIFDKSNPPYASLIIIKHLPNFEKLLTIKENDFTSYNYKDNILNEDVIISKHFARVNPNLQLYGQNPLEKSQIDYWISVATYQLNDTSQDILNILNKALSDTVFLVGSSLTLADIFVWIKFKKLDNTFQTEKLSEYCHLFKWFQTISARPIFKDFHIKVEHAPQNHNSKITMEGGPQLLAKKEKKKDEGKFVELPGAEMGKVVVRFPPEASGYLHIGHAKAALLNQYYQNVFKGKLVMRFDDTNPAKENAEFEKEILHDLELLQVKGDVYSYTSDYFDLIQAHCERLIKERIFYVDDTPADVMKLEREARKASKNRENSIERNVEMWGEMLKGSEFGQKCCVRAKIDMNSNNGCMRDPTMYRCKNEPHIKTGTKYKVYPTYDFACPIVDSVEGVTHALRTTEYHDRDQQYYWLCDALKIRKPHVWAYARLNMQHTVLSKRKLTWLVERGLVEGWDDPRFPTVRGILRRGLTVEGLKQFIVAQGSSKSVVTMEWDKIWSFNRKVIDPIAHRYVALAKDSLVDAYIEEVSEETRKIPLHPKDASLGSKEVYFGRHMLIDRDDACSFEVGHMVTFINLGNVRIESINVGPDNIIRSVTGTYVPDNVDFKNTTKITWLGVKENGQACGLVPISCVKFDYLISKPVLGKDEDFKACINPKETWIEREYVGESALSTVKKSQIIQVLRLGFYICDSPHQIFDPNLCRSTPLRLFSIPDGHTKDMPTTGSKTREINVSTSEHNIKAQPMQEKCVPNGQPVIIRDIEQLDHKIKNQGDLIRQLKNAKASKTDIETQVMQLLALKNEYKSLSGHDWKPIETSTVATSNQINPGNASPNEEKPKLDAASIDEKIKAQGNLVRKLKNEKASKAEIDAQVKQLLALKNEYKTVAGHDWKPFNDSSVVITNNQKNLAKETQNAGKGNNLDAEVLNDKIKRQGDLIRRMKSEKASKADIESQVKQLLALKTQYKLITGLEWTPNASSPQKKTSDSKFKENEFLPNVDNTFQTSQSLSSLCNEIKEQGDKIRVLKAQKGITKEAVSAEVTKLLSLKQNFKMATGLEWKPDMDITQLSNMNLNGQHANSTTKAHSNGHNSEISQLEEQIKAQGDKIRQLKSSKADKATLDPEIKRLLDLKASYKLATGLEYKPPAETQARSSQSQGKKDAKPAPKIDKKVEKVEEKVGGPKKISRLGLEIGKDESFHDWYTQVITKAEMIEYYDVSGCYILRPWSYAIWEAIKDFFDAKIKKLGVQNVYFPIFVSQQALETEKSHIADFSPEVAWVTRSGDSELAEPIAIRPTSETVMYPAYAKWIKSYRDLPLKLNQWNNVVRWEFKHPTPFIRTREFLWQEGHSAFGNYQEAEEEVLVILDLYAKIYEELLAVPVIRGRKTEKEKFAGGDYTTTVEAFIDTSGRGIQGATSHHLGQNFSKIFEIVCENPDTGDKLFVYQNSWGITTRTIGVMVMVHGDDLGLILPPAVAPTQVVIIPCGVTVNLGDEEKIALIDRCEQLAATLNEAGIRAKADVRDNYSPGWKFNHWELKGIPLRIEIGPKELKSNTMMLARRDEAMSGAARQVVSMTEQPPSSGKLADIIKEKLKEIQENLFRKAKDKLDRNLVTLHEWDTFCQHLDQKHIILAPFCGDMDCEDQIKKMSTCEDPADTTGSTMGAKSLCIPFEQPRDIEEGFKCIRPDCSRKPKFYTLFGRSY